MTEPLERRDALNALLPDFMLFLGLLDALLCTELLYTLFFLGELLLLDATLFFFGLLLGLKVAELITF